MATPDERVVFFSLWKSSLKACGENAAEKVLANLTHQYESSPPLPAADFYPDCLAHFHPD
jgi:hypothetical protein